MLALVDGDIVTYSCAAYNENFGWDACRKDIDDLMRRILEETGATHHKTYLTGSENFRYRVNPDYKANRKGKPDPTYRADSNAYLITEWGATVTNGYEADDALGIAATRGDTPSIICTIDKDLNQIAGPHYNWRKNTFHDVTILDGLRWFYRQFLIGDTSDNIVGVAGIGPVKSQRIVGDLENEEDMFQAVQAMYNDDQRLLMNGQCLWILREEEGIWKFPNVN